MFGICAPTAELIQSNITKLIFCVFSSQEECVQLRTVLANMDGQSMSFMSRIGELPDSDEIFAAYETQKNVIGQLKEEVTNFSGT